MNYKIYPKSFCGDGFCYSEIARRLAQVCVISMQVGGVIAGGSTVLRHEVT